MSHSNSPCLRSGKQIPNLQSLETDMDVEGASAEPGLEGSASRRNAQSGLEKQHGSALEDENGNTVPPNHSQQGNESLPAQSRTRVNICSQMQVLGAKSSNYARVDMPVSVHAVEIPKQEHRLEEAGSLRANSTWSGSSCLPITPRNTIRTSPSTTRTSPCPTSPLILSIEMKPASELGKISDL